MQTLDFVLSFFNTPAGVFLDPRSPLYALARALGPVILLLAWFYASRLRSLSSGWADLSASYAAEGPEQARYAYNATVYIGGIKYWKSITFSYSSAGLALKIAWPMRPYHPSLLVPLKDIKDAGKVGYSGEEYRKLLLGASKVSLLLDEEMFVALAQPQRYSLNA